MNKIKLSGTRNIPLLEETPKEGKDYLLSLRVQRISTEKLDKEGEEDQDTIYKLKVLHPESLQEIGTSKVLKIQKGYTKSQILRFAVKDMLKRAGKEDNDENYDEYMDKIIDGVNSKYQD